MTFRNCSNTIEHPEAYERAIRARMIANAAKTWRLNTERAAEIEDALHPGRTYNDYGHPTYTDNFIGSLARAFDSFGKLTPNQCAAILRGIDARAERKAQYAAQNAALSATRAHIGTIGEKITVTLTMKKIIQLEGMQFGRHPSVTYIHIMEDADRNVFVYKGTAAAFAVDEGETVTVTATVKEHSVRNDTKQTIIQRPKAV